jgi:hypothetical protein
MTFNSIDKELDDLAERFHNWKKSNPHRHIPKEYWNDALQCTDKYGPYAVAESIGYSSTYLIQKQRKKHSIATSSLEFVEIQPNQPTFVTDKIQMNIQNQHGVAVDLSFQGGIEQTFPLIYSLFKEGVSCSR